MFNPLKLADRSAKLLNAIAVIALLASVAGTAKHLYDKDIKTEVLTEIKVDTHTQEVKAIEQVIKIDRDVSNLSDADVIKRLRENGDIRPEQPNNSSSQQSQRMSGIPITTVINTRSPAEQTRSIETQHSIPKPLPYIKTYEIQEIIEIESGINPCSDCVDPKTLQSQNDE